MRNYLFSSRNGEIREKEADPSRPETWPFPREEIGKVQLDCTELFLTPCSSFRPHPLPLSIIGEGLGVGSESKKLRDLLNNIATGYMEKLSLNFALEKMGIEKSRFCELFRQETGMTFVAYINKVRVGHAARMLIENDLKAEAVGYDCGFASPSHFYKCFKEHYGVSPARYRVREKI